MALAIWRIAKSSACILFNIPLVQVDCSMQKEAHWQRRAVMNWCSQDLVHPPINNNLWSSIHWRMIDTFVFIHREDIPHNRKCGECNVTYVQVWVKIVHKCFLNIFIISIHGLVYFHQNTKQYFLEFTKTKDAISLTSTILFGVHCTHQCWWCQY